MNAEFKFGTQEMMVVAKRKKENKKKMNLFHKHLFILMDQILTKEQN